MKRFIAAIVGAFILTSTLASCGAGGLVDRVETAISTVQDSSATPKAIAVAILSFDAVKVTATNYTRLPRCVDDGSNRPICRDPALRIRIKQAVSAGTVARNNLKAFLRQHPNSLGDSGLYQALTTATQTLTDATAAYRAAGGK